MSSTYRSKLKEEERFHISDYYITPTIKITEFLNEFMKYEPFAFSGKTLDPCAGGDVDHPMSYPRALIEFGIPSESITTVDIRSDSLANVIQDYLSYECGGIFKTIITNPPFNISKSIIEKAISDVQSDGFVIMLLRLNYLGGALRLDLWNKQMPKYIFVHNQRMGFTDDGKRDSVEYAHFVWQKDYYPMFSQLKVIN